MPPAHRSALRLAQRQLIVDQRSARWVQTQITALNWDRSYPYQLIVVDALPDGGFAADPRWRWTFPLPPEALSLDMANAVDAAVTLGGYVEQRGGSPLRQISLSGTTGVLPLRPQAFHVPSNSLFAGTVRAAAALPGAASVLAGNRPNVVPDADFAPGAAVGRMSGYYQWRQLYQFLESWQEYSRTERGRRAWLALACWKDEAVYVVTWRSFRLARQVPNVYEYPWQLAFQASRRIRLQPPAGALVSEPPARQTPSKLNELARRFGQAQRVLAGAARVVAGVVQDAEHLVFEPLREALAAVKTMLSLPLALADLPDAVLRQCQDAVAQFVTTVGAARAMMDPASYRGIQDDAAKLRDLGRSLGAPSTLAGVGSAARVPVGSSAQAGAVFEDRRASHDFLSSVSSADLRLSPQLRNAVRAERERLLSLGHADWVDRQQRLRRAADALADAAGLGHPVYDAALGRTPGQRRRRATAADHRVLGALHAACAALDPLVASVARPVDAEWLGRQRALADAGGMTFPAATAKYEVVFPLGQSLQRLAVAHLGDPEAWHLIASLNHLQPPYVDEAGFDLPIGAGSGGRVLLLAGGGRLRAGQSVTVAAAGLPRLAARVVRVDPGVEGAPDAVTVDQDASAYVGGAVHAHLPGTVWSGQPLWVPSQDEPEPDPQPGRGGALDQVAGVDLAVTSSNDLVLDEYADTPWAYGLQNLSQTLRIWAATPAGSLSWHPGWGVAVPVGSLVSDLSPEALAASAREGFADDPAFSGVTAASVRVHGSATHLTLALAVDDRPRPVALTVEVER